MSTFSKKLKSGSSIFSAIILALCIFTINTVRPDGVKLWILIIVGIVFWLLIVLLASWVDRLTEFILEDRTPTSNLGVLTTAILNGSANGFVIGVILCIPVAISILCIIGEYF